MLSRLWSHQSSSAWLREWHYSIQTENFLTEPWEFEDALSWPQFCRCRIRGVKTSALHMKMLWRVSKQEEREEKTQAMQCGVLFLWLWLHSECRLQWKGWRRTWASTCSVASENERATIWPISHQPWFNYRGDYSLIPWFNCFKFYVRTISASDC